MISYKQFIKDYKGKGVKVIKPQEQAFRKYSEVIKGWLLDLDIRIPREDRELTPEVLYSYPMKAQALKGATSYKPEGQALKDLNEKLVDLRENRTNIPIISFYLSDFSFDWERQLPDDIRYSETVKYSDGSLNKAIIHQKDRPFELTYVFNFWTKYKADMNIMWQYFLEEFGPTKYFIVDGQEIPLFLENITDASDLESKDGDEQIVRWDMVCTLGGWLKAEKVEVNTIHTQKIIFAETVVKADGVEYQQNLDVDTIEFKREDI